MGKEKLEDLLKEADYDPLAFGVLVLTAMGYIVRRGGFGYNSETGVIFSPLGEKMKEYIYGL